MTPLRELDLLLDDQAISAALEQSGPNQHFATRRRFIVYQELRAGHD